MVELILVNVIKIQGKIEFRLYLIGGTSRDFEEADKFTRRAGIEALGDVMHGCDLPPL
jgi:hypothetical protein